MKAIMHAKGPAMVLAGPGSGKTFVIVRRLEHLIKSGVDPSKILVITFTKAAAIEMQFRFLKLTDNSYPEVSFGTFHSVFYQIIRNNSSKDSKTEIVSQSFKTEMIKDILSSLRSSGDITEDEYTFSCEQIPDILSEISRLKNLDKDPSECLDSIPVKKVFPIIFRDYSKRLLEFGKIDFDDMILRCYDLLTESPSILSFYREKYRYILIDEYQDINPIQYKVIRLLLGEEKNLFAVGDDDQSIYGFRGSEPEIMLSFMDTYKDHGATMINLDINYRCGSKIIQSATKIINENVHRFKKRLVAGPENGSGGVYTRIYVSRQRQMEAIALFLKKHMDELEEIAVLFRSNKEAQSLLNVLREEKIPTNLDEKSVSIYDDKAVKTALDYISFSVNGQKRSDYLKIINVPMRYISRETAPCEVVNERQVLNFYRDNYKRQKEVKSFFDMIKMIKRLRPVLAVRYLRTVAGLDKIYPSSKNALDELMEKAKEFDSTKKFLEAALENTDKTEKHVRGSNSKCVNLLTMHASKGLEFKYVWLPDLNEGIIPARSAASDKQIEEERRMLYVAMTRAKSALIMSYIRGSKENPMLPSRFLRPVKDLFDQSSVSSSGRSTSSSNSTSSR